MTRDGLGALLVAVSGLVVGLVAGWKEIAVLGMLSISMIALSWSYVFSRSGGNMICSTSGIYCTRLEPQTLNFTLSGRTSSGKLLVFVGRDGRKQAYRPTGQHGSLSFELPVDTSRRFDGQVGPFTLVARDPFGFFERVLAKVDPVDLVVVPRIVETPNVESRGIQPNGNSFASRSFENMQASQTVRDYVIGDDPRRIHWPSSARLGTLMIRELVHEFEPEARFVLDCRRTTWDTSLRFSPDNSEQNFEYAVEQFASLVHQALITTRAVTLDMLDGRSLSIDLTSKMNAMRLLAAVQLRDDFHLHDVASSPTWLRPCVVVTHGHMNHQRFANLIPNCIVVDPFGDDS